MKLICTDWIKWFNEKNGSMIGMNFPDWWNSSAFRYSIAERTGDERKGKAREEYIGSWKASQRMNEKRWWNYRGSFEALYTALLSVVRVIVDGQAHKRSILLRSGQQQHQPPNIIMGNCHWCSSFFLVWGLLMLVQL